MEPNSVSPISGELLAPIAEFDKSPPTPPEDEVPMDDLPPPPTTMSVPDTCCKSYDEEDRSWSGCKMCEYIFVVIFTVLLIGGSFGLMIYWVCKYRNGISLEPQETNEGNEKYMNLHYICMTTGLITCSGFSMMLYRLLRCCPRILIKILHFLIHTLSGCLVGYGLKIAYDYHIKHDPAINHLHTLHSWIGIVCVGLFVLQYLLGFVSFVLLAFVSSTEKCRETMSHIHAAIGCVILALAVCAACTSLQRFAIESVDDLYKAMTTEKYIINAIGITFVGVVMVVSYAVRRPRTQYEAKIFVTERL